MYLFCRFRNQFIFFFFSFLILLSSCSFGLDRLDVYSLRLDGAPVFGDISPFLDTMGIPDSVSYYSYEEKELVTRHIPNRDSLEALIKPGGEINLLYEGVEVSTIQDIITMEYIDFSQTSRALHYKGDIVFDKNFTLDTFKKLFPASVANSKSMHIGYSFYQSYKEHKDGSSRDSVNPPITDDVSYQSFLLERKSKYDPFATPWVEFTFKDDYLLAILFLNF